MQIKAVRHKLRIEEIPVSYKNRIGVSKVSGNLHASVRAGFKILWTVLRLKAEGQVKSQKFGGSQ